jgi:hypothetical protein
MPGCWPPGFPRCLFSVPSCCQLHSLFSCAFYLDHTYTIANSTSSKFSRILIKVTLLKFLRLKKGRVWWLMPAIPATLEAVIGRIVVRGQPGHKVHETPSQPMAVCGVACLSSQLHRKYRWEDCGLCPGIKPDPISKITKAKKGWRHGSSSKVPA